MTAVLTPAERDRLSKLLGLIGSDMTGERDAAIQAATRLLDRHGLRWCELVTLPSPPKREPLHSTWRTTCTELAKHSGELRSWEWQFVVDLPRFPRISTKQQYVLNEIAVRMLGKHAA